MDKVNVLTTIVDRCYILYQGGYGELKMVCKLPNETEGENIERVKDLLIFYRQCELFFRYLIDVTQK